MERPGPDSGTAVAARSAAEGPAQGAGAPPGSAGTRRRRHRLRWVAGGTVLALVLVAGVFAYLWTHSGAHPLSSSVAIERFRQATASGGNAANGDGPPAGVYHYRGSGTESLTVPPKSQSEGPGIPGTVVYRDGCFVVRFDYSDAHWQSWDYCVRAGALVSPGRAGYYNWDFVAFHADDTSTFECSSAPVVIPASIVPGRSSAVACTGRTAKLATGPVAMHGTSTVVKTGQVRVGRQTVPAVLVTERVTFSGGQSGSNVATTWFSNATGLPLKGNWHTNVSTPSPFGTSTLDARGDFTLQSLTPSR